MKVKQVLLFLATMSLMSIFISPAFGKTEEPLIPYTGPAYVGTDQANDITYEAVNLFHQGYTVKNGGEGTPVDYIQALSIKVTTNNPIVQTQLQENYSRVNCKKDKLVSNAYSKTLVNQVSPVTYFWKTEAPVSCHLEIIYDVSQSMGDSNEVFSYPETTIKPGALSSDPVIADKQKELKKKIAKKKKSCSKKNGKKTSKKYKKNCLKQVKRLQKQLKKIS